MENINELVETWLEREDRNKGRKGTRPLYTGYYYLRMSIGKTDKVYLSTDRNAISEDSFKLSAIQKKLNPSSDIQKFKADVKFVTGIRKEDGTKYYAAVVPFMKFKNRETQELGIKKRFLFFDNDKLDLLEAYGIDIEFEEVNAADEEFLQIVEVGE